MEVVAHFRAHTAPLTTVAFAPTGSTLATASIDGHHIHVFLIVPRHPLGPPAAGMHVCLLSYAMPCTQASMGV